MQCYCDTTAGSNAICGDVQSFTVPGVQTDPPMNVVATNSTTGSAQLEGSYTGYPAGHQITSWFLYAPCDSYPDSAVRTANRTTSNAPANGALPGVPVDGLPVGVEICYAACAVDDTTNSPPNCAAPTRFTITAPPPTPSPTAAPADCPNIKLKIKGVDKKAKAGRSFVLYFKIKRKDKAAPKRTPPQEFEVGVKDLPPGVTIQSITALPRRRRTAYDKVVLEGKDRVYVGIKMEIDPCFPDSSLVLQPYARSLPSGCIESNELVVKVKHGLKSRRRCGRGSKRGRGTTH